MKKLTTATLLAMGLCCQLQATDLFKPVQETDLRLPSVPLVTSDPYFSIWSPYDKLNEGSTKHWTNDEKSLIGASCRRKSISVHGKTGTRSIGVNGW